MSRDNDKPSSDKKDQKNDFLSQGITLTDRDESPENPTATLDTAAYKAPALKPRPGAHFFNAIVTHFEGLHKKDEDHD